MNEFTGFLGLLVLIIAGVVGAGVAAFVIAYLTAPYWVYWQFPPGGTAEGEIARIAWTAHVSATWSDPPTDISAKVCPLVDKRLKQEVLAAAFDDWHLSLGKPCFTETRTARIHFDAAGQVCTATVRLEPSCAI